VASASTDLSERSFGAERAERRDSATGGNGAFRENSDQYEEGNGPMEDNDGRC